MALVVMKFGGSSVADSERLRNVASIIEKEYRLGSRIIAVLSAQGDMTDEFIAKAKELTPDPDKRELDALISTGEQISAALCAMLLKSRGIDAVSLTGWQAGIVTNDTYGDADVVKVDCGRLGRELDAGKVILLTGFQGVTENGDITTLGRGGSDTTAVCIAAQLSADECRIYKDVDGVYTADPKRDSMARRFDTISYDDMLALADSGARVLHKKCVEIAKRYGVEIQVLSSFIRGGGTVVKQISAC